MKPPKERNNIARDLWTPKYRKRVVPDKKKKFNKGICRNGKEDKDTNRE